MTEHEFMLSTLKSPASTVMDVARALKSIFNCSNEIKIIGIRHEEKIYETLCTREEMAKAEDLGNYYRIRADGRDLNYSKYFFEGEKVIATSRTTTPTIPAVSTWTRPGSCC
jgi:UDP-N-acetylglucosamine 4,6-dehydratase/5-epimerase